MIDCVFTLDYEIYGNGSGDLGTLVYEPGERLKEIFLRHDARFVVFVEVAEFQKIEEAGTDPAIESVKRQIKDYHRVGFEIALHLHPQWCNARHEDGQWLLDICEYNLCTLSRARISEIIRNSLGYLRRAVEDPGYTPLAFRAGNWLLQPSENAAAVLAEEGMKLDSSVFKGGLLHDYNLDYRSAARNGYFWPFSSEVNEPDAAGAMIEVPIYTQMVPFWKMATSKRIAFGKRESRGGASRPSTARKLNRFRDFLRLRYPLKLDFCRMTLKELISMTKDVMEEDKRDPDSYRPLVLIGHTKDLVDPETVDAFLSFLRAEGLIVATFEDIYPKLLTERAATNSPRHARSVSA